LPLLGGLCVLYTIGWYQAAARLEREAAAMQAGLQARYIGLDSAWEKPEGFPFAVRLHSPRWRVETLSGLRWQGDGVTLRFKPWRPFEIEATFDGLHRIDAELGATRRISVALDGARLAVPFSQDGARMIVKSLTYTENSTRQVTIDDFAAQAAVEPAPPQTPDRDGLRQWTAEGGKLAFERMEGRFESARFAAKGWVGLDAALRPIGRVDLELANYAPALRALAARGLLDAQSLPMVEVGLAWLAVPDAKTGAPLLKLPLVAENGALSLGPVRLAALEPLL
jgi:hypothetical protein